jgi:hypothetical protein
LQLSYQPYGLSQQPHTTLPARAFLSPLLVRAPQSHPCLPKAEGIPPPPIHSQSPTAAGPRAEGRGKEGKAYQGSDSLESRLPRASSRRQGGGRQLLRPAVTSISRGVQGELAESESCNKVVVQTWRCVRHGVAERK